jgi:hypothetical protein
VKIKVVFVQPGLTKGVNSIILIMAIMTISRIKSVPSIMSMAGITYRLVCLEIRVINYTVCPSGIWRNPAFTRGKMAFIATRDIFIASQERIMTCFTELYSFFVDNRAMEISSISKLRIGPFSVMGSGSVNKIRII